MQGILRWRRLVACLLFAFCFLADAFVLRSGWTGTQVAAGQFRRGYFERFGERVGLALDAAIRPGLVPSYLLGPARDLEIPPGMVVVAPLRPATGYTLTGTAALAPYLVIGNEAAVKPVDRAQPLETGDARLDQARTLTLRDGALALVEWDAGSPWRDDAARLAALREQCSPAPGEVSLRVEGRSGRFEIRLGSCALTEPLPPDTAPQLAVLPGPEWARLARQPEWSIERWIVWPIVAAAFLKVAGAWWSFGPLSALASSLVLALASPWWQVPAMLTWPLMALAAAFGVIARTLWIVTRRLPERARFAAAVVALLAAAGGFVFHVRSPAAPPLIVPGRENRDRDDRCAVIGYSTVKGEGLRREWGGIRDLLDEHCPACRGRVVGIFAGGERLSWLRDSFCASPPETGARGQVIFLGGANDDLMWGTLAVARLFIVGQQGPDAWRRNEPAAAAQSLAAIDAQLDALGTLMRCAAARGAHFVYAHDFLVTDLADGRGPDRRAMLARRRAAVSTAGGTFIDLHDVFSDEIGIAWFNDYVHFSAPAHARAAALVCSAIE